MSLKAVQRRQRSAETRLRSLRPKQFRTAGEYRRVIDRVLGLVAQLERTRQRITGVPARGQMPLAPATQSLDREEVPM